MPAGRGPWPSEDLGKTSTTRASCGRTARRLCVVTRCHSDTNKLSKNRSPLGRSGGDAAPSVGLGRLRLKPRRSLGKASPVGVSPSRGGKIRASGRAVNAAGDGFPEKVCRPARRPFRRRGGAGTAGARCVAGSDPATPFPGPKGAGTGGAAGPDGCRWRVGPHGAADGERRFRRHGRWVGGIVSRRSAGSRVGGTDGRGSRSRRGARTACDGGRTERPRRQPVHLLPGERARGTGVLRRERSTTARRALEEFADDWIGSRACHVRPVRRRRRRPPAVTAASGGVETRGIEPLTSCLQSRRSPG